MSQTRKSLSYELPLLSQPLTLESADGFTLSVTVVELGSGEEVVREYGDTVTFSLPTTDGSVRYQMTVAVSNRSNGIIIGSIDGQEIGRILLIDSHRQQSSSLTIALGGLSAEWWFSIAERNEDTQVSFALINSPTTRIPANAVWDQLPDSEGYLVVPSTYWREGGYFALKAIFNH